MTQPYDYLNDAGCLCSVRRDFRGTVTATNSVYCPVHGPGKVAVVGYGGGGGGGPSVFSTSYARSIHAATPHGVMEAIASAVSRLLPRASHCVVGEMSDLDGDIRAHVLDDVESRILERVRDEVQRQLPTYLRLHVTSWTQHPPERRPAPARFNVPLPPGTWSNLLPGTACGHCGMREVRARRCGFCGGRA